MFPCSRVLYKCQWKAHLASLEPVLQRPNPTNNLGLPDHIRKLRRVNTDRERADLRVPTLKLDTVRHRFEPEDASAGREEMTGVVVRVEARLISIQI